MTQPDISAQHSAATADRQKLRQYFLKLRQSLNSVEKRQADQILQQKLLDWHNLHKPACLGVYWPIKGEPDLLPAFRQLQQQAQQLALPRVVQAGAPLEFCLWQDDSELQTDRYGIPTPTDQAAVVKPDVLLIPCVGFNRDNFRLGYGGGFYDRTLAQAPRPYTLGIAYTCLAGEFAATEFDIPLDRILTEV